MHVFWFIPTHGDGHYLGTSISGRAITPEYLRQIAQAVDDLGYPALEEAYRTAELLFPHLPLSAPESSAVAVPRLIGEVVANDYRPSEGKR